MMFFPRLCLCLIGCFASAAWLWSGDGLPVVKHVVVSHAADEFAGWPANEGCWSWGDEILVGYNVGRYLSREGTHSLDPEGPQRVAFSRSTDGGLTWTRERSEDAQAFRRAPGGAPAEAIDFTASGAAWKLRYDTWHHSTDRGKTWLGPYRLPSFGAAHLLARTNYVATGAHSALAFLTSSERGVSAQAAGGRSFVAQTTDGGLSFEFLSWIGPDLAAGLKEEEMPAFSTMPSAVRVGENHFVCALRQRINRRKWTDIFESRDGGKTWAHASELERGATNPAALVALGGQRLAAIYGCRRKPFGLRAKLSEDAGRTWSEEIVLRDDGRTWDIGYPRAMLRPDGVVVALYYYTTTERPEQHIAATLWKPPAATGAR